VLVLDEPTNDLDIDTLELLEQLLQEYAGTLFLVSHDRTFLDNVVTQVIAFEGDGLLREYPGGYSDWESAQQRMSALADGDSRKPSTTASAPAAPKRPASDRRRGEAQGAGPSKLTYREKQELTALPTRIEELEAKVTTLQQRLADPALYQGDPADARQAASDLQAAEEGLREAYARWEVLEDRNVRTGGS